MGTNGGGFSRLQDDKFTTYRVAGRQQSNMIACILEDSAGVIWGGTVDGLYYMAGDSLRRFSPKSISGPVNGLVQSTDGWMWIVTSAGLFRISPGSDVPQKINFRTWREADIDCIHASRDSTVWVGLSDGELLQLRRDNVLRQLQVGRAGIGYLLEDGQGYLAASSDGIYRVPADNGRPYLCYSSANGLPENFVASGAIDSEGNLWLGLVTKGIAKLANRSIVTLPIPAMSYPPNGTSAAVDRNNHLWAVSSAGLWEIWMGNDRTWHRVLNPARLSRVSTGRPSRFCLIPRHRCGSGAITGRSSAIKFKRRKRHRQRCVSRMSGCAEGISPTECPSFSIKIGRDIFGKHDREPWSLSLRPAKTDAVCSGLHERRRTA